MSKVLNLDQSGPDWHKWRADGLGGSDACAVMGDVGWTSPDELMEIKLGFRHVQANEAMERGKRLEPDARALYQSVTGNLVRPVCVQHDEYPWLRASLDGLSLDEKLVLEIKCPLNPSNHRKTFRGHYPAYYKAQLQHQLLVTGAEVLHYWSYYPDDGQFAPERQYRLVEVHPDREYQKKLFRRERAFWERLKKMRQVDLLRPVLQREFPAKFGVTVG